MPLALASAGVLVLFMSLRPFDANRYPHVDIFTAAFPQQRERAQQGERAGGRQMDHTGGHTGSSGRAGHQSGSTGHGRRQSGSMGHGSGRNGSLDHGGAGTSSAHGNPSDSFSIRKLIPGDSFGIRRFTVGTGYLALAFLALTLLIGPANLVRRRRNPVSGYLRRDVGAWTAILSVVHVIYGLQVHRKLSDFFHYFVASDGTPLTNSFGLGNWTGLAALVIVAVLLALSSDAALRRLKAKNWKRLQRLNYALFALVIVHAFFYGALLRTSSPYTLLLLLSVIAVVVGQAAGVLLYRRRHSPRTAQPA